MTPSDFAKQLRAKYPGTYDDIPDEELTNKVISKYPQYSDMVDKQTSAPPTQVTQPSASLSPTGLYKSAVSDFYGNIAGVAGAPGQAIKMGAEAVAAPAQMLSQTVKGQSPDFSQTSLGQETTDMVNQAKEQGAEFLKHPIKSIATHPVTTALTAAGFFDTAFGSGLKGDIADAVTVKQPSFLQKLLGTFREPVSPGELSDATDAMQGSVNKAMKTANEHLNTVKSNLDLSKDLDERVSDLTSKKPTFPNLVKEYQDYFKTIAPGEGMPKPMMDITVQRLPTQKGGISPNTGKPIEPVQMFNVKGPRNTLTDTFGDAEPGSVPEETLRKVGLLTDHGIPQEEIAKLYNLKKGLSDQLRATTLDQAGNTVKAIAPSDEGTVQAMIGKINDRIEQIPGGDKLRGAEKNYSDIRGMYDDIQKKMSEPGKAQDFLKQLFTSKKGQAADFRDKLAQIDVIAGTNNLQKMMDLYTKQAATFEPGMLSPYKTGVKALLAGARKTGAISRGIGNATLPAFNRPFNTPEVQNLLDRVKNANQDSQ